MSQIKRRQLFNHYNDSENMSIPQDECYDWAVKATGYKPLYFEKFLSIQENEKETSEIIDNMVIGSIGGAFIGLILNIPISLTVSGAIIGGITTWFRNKLNVIEDEIDDQELIFLKEERQKYNNFHQAYKACQFCNSKK